MWRIIFFVLFLDSCKSNKQVLELERVIEFAENRIWKLKSGNFYIRKTIELPSNITLLGNETTFFVDDNSELPIFRINNTHNIVIKNIKIKGDKCNVDISKEKMEYFNHNYFVEIKNAGKIKIDNCDFSNSYGTVIKIMDSKNVDVVSTQFKNIGVATQKNISYSYDGIFIGGYHEACNINITACQFENIGANFPSGNPPWPNDGDGVHIQGVGKVSDVTIQNSRFISCSARGVKIQTGNNINILRNNFQNCRSAVNMAMAKPIHQINLSGNQINNCQMTFGTDGGKDVSTVTDLKITNNTVDSCEHFLRTSGNSIVNKALIVNNIVGRVGTYFLLGRFLDTEVKQNKINEYATIKDGSYNMAIYLSPESDNVQIINNSFIKNDKSNREIINKSNKRILIKQNIFLEKSRY